MHGFTCGVDDLLIMESKDKDRKRLLEKCEEFGEDVHLKFVGVKDENIGMSMVYKILLSNKSFRCVLLAISN